MTLKIDSRKLFEPIKATCGKCGGEAWIVPFGGNGQCWCAHCTFGEKGLTLIEMLQRVYGKDT